MHKLKSTLSLLLLYYLRFWAKKQLAKNSRAIVIGITGSMGKTSTRLALVSILARNGIVKHSIHANSESGIPLNILGIKLTDYSLLSWIKVILLAPYQYATFHENYDYYVVEMGIDSPYPPKNMGYLLSIIRPDIAIILGVSLVHAAAFDHLVSDTVPSRRETKLKKLIAKEKMRLARSVPPSGTVVCNIDDPYLRTELKGITARVVTIGYRPQANYRLRRFTTSPRGSKLIYQAANSNYTLALSNPFGSEYGLTFLAAIAAAHALGIGHTRAQQALNNYRAPAGRMRIFNGKNGTHLIDSSYNASPASMQNALSTLKKLGKDKTLAVLGDMRELGALTKRSHQQLASIIPDYTRHVLLYGPAMRDYAYPLLSRTKEVKVEYAATIDELIARLKVHLRPGFWVLFKGSQNTILLERAVEAVLNDPADITLLPRRGAYWDQIRSLTP